MAFDPAGKARIVFRRDVGMVQRASESPLKGQALAGRQSIAREFFIKKSMLLTRSRLRDERLKKTRAPLTATGSSAC